MSPSTSQRLRRRKFYLAYAVIFGVAAVGLLVLVWFAVAGIPRAEARRIGENQISELRYALRALRERYLSATNFLHFKLAANPAVVEGRTPVDSDFDSYFNLLVRGLGFEDGSARDAIALVRFSVDGKEQRLYPRETPSLLLPSNDPEHPRHRETIVASLVAAAKSQSPVEPAMPEPLGDLPRERRVLVFNAPIYEPGQGGAAKFKGALCLFVSVEAILRDCMRELVAYRPESSSFVLGWKEAGPGSRENVQILWHSNEPQDVGPLGGADWQKSLVAAISDGTTAFKSTGDQERTRLLDLPLKAGGVRLEIVSYEPFVFGTRRWALFRSLPYSESSNNAASQQVLLISLGSVAIGILITSLLFFAAQIVQRERELKAVETSYRELFAENPTAMLVLNDRSEVVDCNESALRMMGLGAAAAKGVPLSRAFTAAQVEPLWTELLKTGELGGADARLQRSSDGEVAIVEIRGRRIGDRWIMAANDVGQRRDFEQQLARMKRMDSMGSLASTLGHDFNNLLGQIQILVSNLRADSDPESALGEDLLLIEQKVEDASQLVAGILAFRENVLSPHPVELSPVLDDFVSAERKVLPVGVELAAEVPRELPSVWITPHALRRVMDNLCRNASDAMPQGGRLLIRAGVRTLGEAAGADQRLAPGLYAVVEVVDTGSGMSDATLERLFQPYFTTKHGRRGTGLGLWTVYKMLRQLGGAINPYSELGRGSRFEILLPHDPPTREHSWIRKENLA